MSSAPPNPLRGVSDAPPPFLQDTPEDVARAVRLLREGEVVAVPTETVYGLAADALNTEAVRRIFFEKGRPFLDPLIVHAFTLGDAARAAEIPPALAPLAEHFWPGPLTVVLRKRECVPALVTAGNDTVAVRVPAHPLMRKVLERSGLLLAAPSANPFGYISPTRASHVRDSFGGRVPWILDGGECRHGLESTILHLSRPDGVPVLLRPGPISRDAIEAVLKQRVLTLDELGGAPLQPSESASELESASVPASLPAPGMLTRHYSPHTPVVLRAAGAVPELGSGTLRQAVVWQRRPEAGVVAARAAGQGAPVADEYWFSEDGAPDVVARNVFALLRQLDTLGYAALHVELAPDSPLAPAINDRLRRAAAKRA